MPQTDQPSGISLLLRTISEYLKLLVEDARLNAAEKLTKLLSVCVLFVLLTMLITVAMLFLTIAVSLALSAAITRLGWNDASGNTDASNPPCRTHGDKEIPDGIAA